MRHRNKNKRFGRNKAQRKQLMCSLVRALFISYRIETTVEKAKEARRLAEKLITHAKKAKLSDIRAIEKVLQDRRLTSNIVKIVAPLFKERNSGFTRIMRIGFRKGDGASLAILELTEKPVLEKKSKKKKEEKSKQAAEGPGKTKKEAKPAEALGKEVKEKPSKDKPLPPKADKKAEKLLAEEEPKKESKKSKKDEPSDKKKGILGKFKGFFKKDRNF
ncbi:MAG: 50S ribosomal protein L17 [Candidatus Omnitrophota bacterium]